jgi:hypothetical protein
MAYNYSDPDEKARRYPLDWDRFAAHVSCARSGERKPKKLTLVQRYWDAVTGPDKGPSILRDAAEWHALDEMRSETQCEATGPTLAEDGESALLTPDLAIAPRIGLHPALPPVRGRWHIDRLVARNS